MDLIDWWAPAPCQGLKGPDISRSNSKASQFAVFLLKETVTPMKPSRTMLLSPDNDCTDSGRRNTELNCRDADASVDQGHMTSPDSQAGPWYPSQERNAWTKESEGSSVIESYGLLPYICWMGGTEECELVFLNPFRNPGFSLLQKRAIWPNDTFQLCSATQPRCWSTLDVLIHSLSK